MTPGNYPLDRAFAIVGLPPTVKLVLLHMAKIGNQTHQCFASQKKLAEWSGCSIRSVRRAQNYLLAVGLIVRIPSEGRKTNRFVLQTHLWKKYGVNPSRRGGL